MRQGSTLTFSFCSLLWCAAAAAANPALPAYPEGSFALEKTSLTISFNPLHHQADWVAYDLGPEHLQNCVQRADSFRADPAVPYGKGASLADYRGSGYDRGHLSPAGDNKWSPEAMHESFLLSNISPQPPAFNRGIWAKLEGLVRAWARERGGLWVATGPVLKRGLATIGDNEISIPDAFYKVLITKDERHALALELPTDARGDLRQYARPVLSVEQDSGLDFFPALKLDEAVETDLDLAPWDFKARFRYDECQDPNEGYSPMQPIALPWFMPQSE